MATQTTATTVEVGRGAGYLHADGFLHFLLPVVTTWVPAAAQQLADDTGRPVIDVDGAEHEPAAWADLAAAS